MDAHMYTVMVTGGLGSGKSQLVRELCALGATSIDLDEIGHLVLEEDEGARAELAACFGDDIVDEGGGIDRALLARRAFASPQATAQLDAVMSPRILARAADYLVDVHCVPVSDAPVQVVEVALLERVPDFAALADERIAVAAPSDLRLARAVERGMDAADAMARIAAQASDAERARIADVVCDNSGTRAELAAWAKSWWDAHVAAGDWAAPVSPTSDAPATPVSSAAPASSVSPATPAGGAAPASPAQFAGEASPAPDETRK